MNNSPIQIITIDGTSGVGKGTISTLLAKKLGWHLLDSGSLYRVLAYYAMEKKIDLQDENALTDLAETLIAKDYSYMPGIRSEDCSKAASKVAKSPKVRKALLELQRKFVKPPGLIADGRDMGTVVFPNAQIKFFLDASLEERAKRRYIQLKEKGLDVTLSAVIEEMSIRDLQDRERVISPMKPADDAIVIDTTFLSIEEVFIEVSNHVPLLKGDSAL